jgi:hypothetical protein
MVLLSLQRSLCGHWTMVRPLRPPAGSRYFRVRTCLVAANGCRGVKPAPEKSATYGLYPAALRVALYNWHRGVSTAHLTSFAFLASGARFFTLAGVIWIIRSSERSSLKCRREPTASRALSRAPSSSFSGKKPHLKYGRRWRLFYARWRRCGDRLQPFVAGAYRNHGVLLHVERVSPISRVVTVMVRSCRVTHRLRGRTRAWAQGVATVAFSMFTFVEASAEAPRIKISAQILTQAASQVALGIQLERSDPPPYSSFIRFQGLPPSVSLTEGFATGPGVWAVPLVALATLKVNVPVGVAGHANFLITLVDVEGTILAEATSELIVEPGTAPTDQHAAARSAEHKAFSYRPAGYPPPLPPLAERSDPHLESLLTAGQRHLAHGNITAARAFFLRAAEAGVAAGATLLATTYDPIELQRLKVVGLVGDRNEALKWYERARELGAADDPFRVTGCKC